MKSNQILTANAHSLISAEKNKQKSRDVDLDTLELLILIFLNNEQAPFCIPCNEPFTVKHFLVTCAEFNYIRTKYFNVKNIKELFNIPTQKILDFLKEIGLFNKI